MNISELSIIFIGGIHGVGKTKFSEMASKLLGVPRLSASELITHQIRSPAAINKRVQNVGKNQNALISAIESYPLKDTKFILDGHFCVLDSLGVIQKIPIETFRELAPVAVIVLLGYLGQIQKRLLYRDKRKFPRGLLNNLQEAEKEHAKRTCRLLNIPICLARGPKHEKTLQFINNHLKGKEL
jgi:adenylate kinase